VGEAIQNTDEPSSDRLIQERRPLTRRLSFFSESKADAPAVEIGCLYHLRLDFSFVLRKVGCWLKKHRGDAPLDSPGRLAYFVGVIRLENP